MIWLRGVRIIRIRRYTFTRGFDGVRWRHPVRACIPRCTGPDHSDYHGFLLAILPPGAFLGMGFLIALKNVIDKYLEKRALAKTVAVGTVDATT